MLVEWGPVQHQPRVRLSLRILRMRLIMARSFRVSGQVSQVRSTDGSG